MTSRSAKKAFYGRFRLFCLATAFCLILVVPALNKYLHFSFIQGWFQSLSIGHLWFVSPLEGIESILTSKTIYAPLLVGMLGPVLLALLLGRVFCSWICPISFLSELLDRFIRLVTRKRFRKQASPLPRKLIWFALLGEVIITLIIGAPIFVFLSPPGLVGREIMMATLFHTLAIEGIIVVIVLLLHMASRRLFCRYLCPLGALLGILGIKRRLIITKDPEKCVECSLCKKACPLGLDPATGETTSAYCWNCGECIDICKTRALTFRW
ncbi:MAG: nitrate reductase [Thermodesulfatator sp.]|nr:MAG: nitrate reductase [Thermodesulfatator sp.]